MPVSLIDHQKTKRVKQQTIRARAKRLLEFLTYQHAELSLLLTENDEIQMLNKTWRQTDQATDVLSFPQGEGPLLGDVVISTETAEMQAKDTNGWARTHAGVKGEWTVLDEVTLLLVHGVLHLLGFDHKKAQDAEKMRKKEAELFKKLSRQKRKKNV